ncbi:MAG TPA: glycosyltransferase family 2 protein [Terriglobales bacterium]|nr:glycosyltransferase family 2 protein [Terriglobales bacterium]
MADQKKIFIVIPAYQAAKTIRSVFERLPAQLKEKDYRIVVVNDGSTDGTGDILRQIAAERTDTEVIEHERNKGYAQAQKTGFTHALQHGADIAVLLHADGQYAPELLLQLLEPLERGEADLVQGSRMLNGGALRGGMPMYKYIANKSLTALENFAYGLKMGEYHSGYMLYSRKLLESVPFTRLSDTFHFDGEMILMASKRKLKIKEIAIPTRYAEEESHLKPIQYGMDVLKIIWKNFRGGYNF